MDLGKLLRTVCLIITCFAWALASPIGSNSDDDYHLTKIWCGLGERHGACEYSNAVHQVRIPLPIAHAGNCYLGDNEKSASCTNEELRLGSNELIDSPRGIAMGRNSLFYTFNSLFVLSNIEFSILLMRVANVAILVGLLILAVKSSKNDDFDRLLLALLITCVPSVLFIVNSNNSSSWTFMGAAFSWFFAHQFVKESSIQTRNFSLVGIVFSGLLCIGSRSESAIYFPLHVVCGSILGVILFPSIKSVRRGVVASTISLGVGIWIFERSSAHELLQNGFLGGDDDTPIMRVGHHVLFSNLLSVSDLYTGLLGGLKGIGASATELPGTVSYLAVMVLGYVVISSVAGINRRSCLLILGLCAIMATVPLYILQKNNLFVGEELVPRYLYPFLILFVGSVVFANQRPIQFSRKQVLLLAILLATAHSVALRIDILRHTRGIDQYGILNLDAGKEWWWTTSIPASPMMVWVLGSIGFFTAALLQLNAFTREAGPYHSVSPLTQKTD